MEHCRQDYRAFGHILQVCPWDQFGQHIQTCSVCQLRVRFAEAMVRRVNKESKSGCGPSTGKLVDSWNRFKNEYLVRDDHNQRYVVKQEYCFCGTRASTIPLPQREGLEQRANLECSACGTRWRAAHCRQGCGMPLDDRFDELCDRCRWIKCPADHCSNADCDHESETA